MCVLTCDGITVFIFKEINKYFQIFSVLIPSMVNIDKENTHKQNLFGVLRFQDSEGDLRPAGLRTATLIMSQ